MYDTFYISFQYVPRDGGVKTVKLRALVVILATTLQGFVKVREYFRKYKTNLLSQVALILIQIVYFSFMQRFSQSKKLVLLMLLLISS